MIRTIAVVAAATVALVSAAASPASERAVGSLDLRASLSTNFAFGPYCSPGTAPGIECVRFVGSAGLAGLGQTTVRYVKTVGDPECPDEAPVRHFDTVVFDVAGKGTIEMAETGVFCGPPAPATVGPIPLAVTGGTGVYAGASGLLSYTSSTAPPQRCATGLCGGSSDQWSGTLTVPGHAFDLTAPVLSGAVSRTVWASKRATRARVQLQVAASDDVDTSVTAACKPASGTAFRLGRTRVTCTATDSSANTSRATFTVTVKRRK